MEPPSPQLRAVRDRYEAPGEAGLTSRRPPGAEPRRRGGGPGAAVQGGRSGDMDPAPARWRRSRGPNTTGRIPVHGEYHPSARTIFRTRVCTRPVDLGCGESWTGITDAIAVPRGSGTLDCAWPRTWTRHCHVSRCSVAENGMCSLCCRVDCPITNFPGRCLSPNERPVPMSRVSSRNSRSTRAFRPASSPVPITRRTAANANRRPPHRLMGWVPSARSRAGRGRTGGPRPVGGPRPPAWGA